MIRIRKPTEQEEQAALKWLKGELLMKDIATEMDCVGTSPGVYIRLCRAIRSLYEKNVISEVSE